ncbi:MAG: flagellar brake protein [Zoogloeaceae bacterium]|jgi:c-di-GMP-binding flagellar brake protein YcgR|nr:flagellar brake protein [Zoogloeaceae bacterium]
MSETEAIAPSHLELEEEADVYRQFFLHSPTEVVFVLRDAMQKGCMMTVYFDMGRSFFLSSLLKVGPEGMVLDYGSHEETNQRALKSNRLICTLRVEQVKVQFALPGLSRIHYENGPAFAAPLPENVLRLQRREYFRITTPIVHPLKCEIPLARPDDPEDTRLPLTLPVFDISAGGVGLRVSEEEIHHFDHDSIFRDCALSLPETGSVKLNLHVRTVLEITPRSGYRHFRVGCKLVDMSRALPTIIQRYITALERERKARASGLE